MVINSGSNNLNEDKGLYLNGVYENVLTEILNSQNKYSQNQFNLIK
tara:strand:- start:1035 stop:1172 length:138 start_codon:yes stop_codon:yes gene_type:complete